MGSKRYIYLTIIRICVFFFEIIAALYIVPPVYVIVTFLFLTCKAWGNTLSM